MDPYESPPEGDPAAAAAHHNVAPSFNPLAIISLVCGLLSVFACCCLLFLPIPLVGLVCGLIGISQINANPQTQKGKELAIIGVVLSGLFLALFAVLMILNVAGVITPEMLDQQRFR